MQKYTFKYFFTFMACELCLVVAMWREQELYLCESNAFSPYWPVNGVQCNKYEEWTQYALGADYNVVWAPMEQSISDGDKNKTQYIHALKWKWDFRE